MRAPKSFTKEDVVEINCHGGIVALRRVLELVLEKGARLAEPGEFTKRAFLNGRIDLAQAEAVLDIIRAKTDAALKIGMQQLKGALSTQLNKIREELLDILTVLEANIDFPEEEIGAADLKKVMNRLNNADKELRQILDSSQRGKILREGINVVICGKPNVGKSSLLNTLLKTERSIVSHIPGTTRDTIEEIIDIKGVPIKIVDTAGIIEPKDLVERKAIQRARKYIDSADLVILLFDASKKLSKEDNLLMRRLKNKPVVAAINKIDLRRKIEKAKIRERFLRVVDISAKKAQNINCLEEAILDLVSRGKADTQPESMLLSNARHIEAIKEAQKLIVQAIDLLDNGMSIEFIAQDLKDALSSLDNILGKTFSEDLLDNIFSQFCIGK
jgi:tRNA modification GTPase